MSFLFHLGRGQKLRSDQLFTERIKNGKNSNSSKTDQQTTGKVQDESTVNSQPMQHP